MPRQGRNVFCLRRGRWFCDFKGGGQRKDFALHGMQILLPS